MSLPSSAGVCSPVGGSQVETFLEILSGPLEDDASWGEKNILEVVFSKSVCFQLSI